MQITHEILRRIDPRHHPKFSPNLFRWLMKRGERHRRSDTSVFRDTKGTLWIGYIDDEYNFVGCRLMAVLCNGSKEYPGWFSRLFVTEIGDFWDQYAKIGRCAIDPKHTMVFVGDDTRWKVDGNIRQCLWCGKETQGLMEWIEPVLRNNWVTINPEGSIVDGNV